MIEDGAVSIQSTLEPVQGIALLEGYPAALQITPRPDHYDVQGHLNNAAAIRIIQDLRVTYMRDVLGRRRIEGMARGHIVGVREMVTSYIAQAHPGEQLYGGCRILGRSRRSWCFDELICTADRVVVRCRLIECAIHDGRAVEVPADFWAAVEQAEGRELPIRELPVGRTPWDVM